MKKFRNSLLILVILVAQGFCYHQGYIQSRGGSNSPRNPFQSRNTRVEDDSVEHSRDQSLYPWRHHVDFDERHPGEDQIAVETRQDTNPHRRVLRRPPYTSSRQAPQRGNSPYHGYHDSLEMEAGDDEFRSPFDMRVTTLSDFFNPATDQQTGPSINQNWMSMFGNTPFAITPWWKGSNVCIKREEEDENVEKDSDDSSDESRETETIIPKSAKFTAKNDSSGGSPEFHLKLSACEDLDTKYICTTSLFGPSISKTIRTEYECCHGYILNTRKQICERGHLENVAKTIEEVGGKEFMRLAKSAALDGKLERETLTVFVPTDEAFANFKANNADNDIESVN